MTAPTDEGRGGFALLLVLWVLVLISLFVSQMASTGRREARIAGNLAAEAKAEAAADGAVYETIFRLLDTSSRQWTLDGRNHVLATGDAVTTVRIESETGKINPNAASPELLAGLLVAVGADQAMAQRIAAAIVEWRETDATGVSTADWLAAYQNAGLDHGPPGEPFQSLDEVGRVLGMTPSLLALVKPHLSLFQAGPPDPAFADPVIRNVLSKLPVDPDADPTAQSSGLDAVTITADSRIASGGHFIRRAVIRLGASFERGYMIGEWSAP